MTSFHVTCGLTILDLDIKKKHKEVFFVFFGGRVGAMYHSIADGMIEDVMERG